MAFLMSPSVDVNEIDFGGIAAAVATTIGATVGYASDGLPNQRVFISTKDKYINEFYNPDGTHYLGYTALEFLEEGNQLWVVRATNGARSAGIMVEDATAYGSASSQLTCGVTNQEKIDDLSSPTFDGNDQFVLYLLRPGTRGNDFRLGIVNYSDTTDSTTALDLEVQPSNVNEFVVLLYRYYSNTDTYELLEQHLVTRIPTSRSLSNRSIFIEDVVNNQSDYMYCFNNGDSTNTPPSYLPSSDYSNLVSFSGGANGSEPTLGQYTAGWEKFNNAEDVDVRILMANGGELLTDSNKVTLFNSITSICESRKDCFAIIDFPAAGASYNTAQELVDWRRLDLNINSSYASLYGPWVKVYDRYNDKYVWIPTSGIVGSVYVKNDHMAESWFAPAGFRRGMITIEEGAFNPDSGDRDFMYLNNINPVVTFKGEGSVILGQKTLQTRPSPTDRVNVRRLLIEVEKATSTSARQLIFEPNDDYTRLQARGIFDSYLEDVKSRRGLDEFQVVCNDDNNTGAVIQSGRLIIDIYLKPIFAAEWIVLNFNILRADANINEYITAAI